MNGGQRAGDRIRGLLGHTLVQNALSLYGVQIASYVVPLATIPYLARVLGAAGWGTLAFAQSFGFYVALIGEYGFGYSATRAIAQAREDREKLAEIVAGVQGAKALLALASLGVAAVAYLCVPVFREHPALLWSALFWALAFGFNMMWFFQGFERMHYVAILDVGSKILATIGVFFLVRRPDDAWRVLAIQGAGLFCSFVVGVALAYRMVAFRLPSVNSVKTAMRMGWSMFLFRNSVSLYTTGNAFILGLFVSPQIVGYYAGAEKVSKAFVGLLNPITQTLYPRLSHLAHHARDRAVTLAKIGFWIMSGGGVCLGVLIFVSAPLVLRVALGPGFGPAVPVLRVLALLAPLISLNNVFGIQWMLPLGKDRAFNRIILLAGILNIILASLLAPAFAAMGMAWSVVTAEFFVVVSIYAYLRWRKLDPISGYRVAPNAEIL